MPTGVTAYRESNGVRISWNAALDSNGNPVAGYHVYRASSPAGPYSQDQHRADHRHASLSTLPVLGGRRFRLQAVAAYYYGVTSEDDDGDESAQTLGISPASLASSSGSGGSGGGGGGCFIGSAASYYSWNENFNAAVPMGITCIGLLLFAGIGLFFWHVLSERSKNIDNLKMIAGHNI